MKLALVGYGSLGRYIEAMIAEAFHPTETIYFDDQHPGAQPFASYDADRFADFSFFVSLGYRHLGVKKQIVERLLALGRTVPSYVHPSAYAHPTVKLGAGSMVYPGCSIDRNTVIGRGTWITNADVIAHDCVIGDACWFGATVTLSGEVTVGDRTFIGSGTTVGNHLTIGSGSIIGMGTCVTKSLGDTVSAIGNPMRILERPLKLV
jgi:sugar O-acyltransferase (sialic acid O-acetyltransferase NeuD family)